LITRAQQRCGGRAGEVRVAHRWLLAIAHTLEPADGAATGAPVTGARVRQQVEAQLVQIETVMASGHLASWLRPALTHLVTILRRLGDGLYQCYDGPDLPRTDNGLEQFYRRVKACERRITGHRRSDQFVMRVGSAAIYAVAAGEQSEAILLRQIAGVDAVVWQAERAKLRAHQERQTTMRRFRLRRDTFLTDLEARWTALTEAS
jgi:hypothetical protein